MAIHIPLAIAAAGAVRLVSYFLSNRKEAKVFISFYSKEDAHYKRLLTAWSKNPKFKISFKDVSTDIKINSKDKTYLKRRMRSKIEEADYFIIFVGENTHTRDWVLWEIEQAKILKKKIIAVKEKKSHSSPEPLLGCGAKWVIGFTEEGIRTAMKEF